MSGLLANVFRRLFSSRSHRMPADLRQDPVYNYKETALVAEIAFLDALELGQELSPVHVLGAALYRLRDADPNLAARLSSNFLHVRRWAMENLPSRRRFSVESLSLDHDYTVYVQENQGVRRLKVTRVNRPVRKVIPRATEPVDGSEHSHGIGRFIAVSGEEPVNRDRTERAYQLLFSCESPGETPEPTIVFIHRILARLMDDWQVQDCIAARGVTPQELLAELEPPPA